MKEMVGGCCVCSDERGWTENPLVYCDGQNCNVAVHQACYGIVQVPSNEWYCRKCESQERSARVHSAQRCELCPSKDGALKRTDNAGWAHVVCALYVPEVRFGNVTTMEPIILQLVPQERFNRSCYICEEQGKESKATVGACMQCNKSGCKQYFHVTCAQAAGLLCEEAGNYMDNVKYCGYCHYHYQKLKKDGNIKPIPAFKPIPADNATPEPSPEKLCSPKGARMRRRATTEGASEEEANSNRSSKFTTANFTETVVAPGGSPVFAAGVQNSNKKKKSSLSSSSSPCSSTSSSAPLSSPPREDESQTAPLARKCRKRSEGGSDVKKKRSCGSPDGAADHETDHTYHRAVANGCSPGSASSLPELPAVPLDRLASSETLTATGNCSSVPLVLPPSGIRMPFTEHFVPPPSPQTLEQLLERQWEQGSQFLMEQAQHFDSKASGGDSSCDGSDPSPPTVAALLSCLHQLRSENRKLENHVGGLVARRDHLLAVNARLALPLAYRSESPNPADRNTTAAAAANLYLENGTASHSPQEMCSPSPVACAAVVGPYLTSMDSSPRPVVFPVSQEGRPSFQTISPPYSTPSPTSSLHPLGGTPHNGPHNSPHNPMGGGER